MKQVWSDKRVLYRLGNKKVAGGGYSSTPRNGIATTCCAVTAVTCHSRIRDSGEFLTETELGNPSAIAVFFTLSRFHRISALTGRTMSCPKLPPELIDQVFDHFQEDRWTLKACSLVCKAWLNFARRQLFSETVLDSRSVATLFDAESGSSVAPFIRRLHVTHCQSDFWNDTLPSLLRFEGVVSLSTTNLPWREMSPRAQSSLFIQFGAIIRLHLHRVDTVAFSHLAQIICGFPRLETLILGFVVWRKPDSTPPTLSLPRLFRALELESSNNGQFLTWLCSFGQNLALHTLHLNDVERDDCRTISTLLRTLGPSLETFRFRLASVKCPINLRHNTHLRSIHLDVWQSHEGDTGVAQLLSQIVSERMREVSLSVGHFGCNGDDFLLWNEVDDILSRPQFSNLERVYVIPVRWNRLYLSTWPIDHLPLCYTRGILRIRELDHKTTFL